MHRAGKWNSLRVNAILVQLPRAARDVPMTLEPAAKSRRADVAVAVALAAALAAAVFRIRLAGRAVTEFDGAAHHPNLAAAAFAAQHAWQDAGLAVLCGALAWPAARLLRNRGAWLRSLAMLPWFAALLVLGALEQTHFRLSFSLHIGLTWPLLVEAVDSGTLGALTLNAQPDDIAWSTMPALLLPAMLLLSAKWPRAAQLGAGALLAALVLPSLVLPEPAGSHLAPDCHASPVWLLASSWAGAPPAEDVPAPRRHAPSAAKKAETARRSDGLTLAGTATPSTAEDSTAEGLRPADLPFAPPLPHQQPPLPPSKPWNIVWIVMESTGTRYFEGETHKGDLPMPYLHELAGHGWYLAHHRSPSNSSATSIFAQFSGLFPLPATRMFSIQKDNAIPSLFSFLGADYDRFLVTPGKLTYFFPKAFLQHSGLTEMYGFDEVPVTKNPGGEGLSKDEPEVVSFFLQRLHRARAPFAAVYYSYVAHWEYTDYGPKYRHFHGARLIDHYHDNLWLLDQQIQRIVEQLRSDGLLDSTILVFAGDHGEAFGQHAENWAHARGAYEENFQTPAILVQPRLFAPRVIGWDTSHVDLLPTVLDALGLPFEPKLVQGESLLRGEPKRKALFFWGNEGTVTSIAAGIKVVLGGEQRCQAYDLNQDPRETRRLPCERFSEQLAALREWRDFQRRALPEYNEAAQLDAAWQGLRQPLQKGTNHLASLPSAAQNRP